LTPLLTKMGDHFYPLKNKINSCLLKFLNPA
jgi:hypothetical protein